MQADQFQLNSAIEHVHWWFVARRRILRELIAQVLPPSPQTMIVDVGCGTGGNVASLSEDYTCVGIDPSPEAVELASRRFPGVRFLRGHAPDDLGDVVSRANLFLLTDVLEHTPDDFALLSRLLSVASPGAWFLLTVPADSSLWSTHDESHGHYRRYDRERFEQLWQGLPVTVPMVSHFNSRLYPLVKWMRKIHRVRGKACGEAGTDIKMPSRWVNRLLTRSFVGESRVLGDLLQGKRRRGFRRGVSLIGLLRREAGRVAPRIKPPHVAPDRYDPVAGRILAAEFGETLPGKVPVHEALHDRDSVLQRDRAA